MFKRVEIFKDSNIVFYENAYSSTIHSNLKVEKPECLSMDESVYVVK